MPVRQRETRISAASRIFAGKTQRQVTATAPTRSCRGNVPTAYCLQSLLLHTTCGVCERLSSSETAHTPHGTSPYPRQTLHTRTLGAELRGDAGAERRGALRAQPQPVEFEQPRPHRHRVHFTRCVQPVMQQRDRANPPFVPPLLANPARAPLAQSCAETPAPSGTERSARSRSRLKLSSPGRTGSACSTLAASAVSSRPLYAARISATISVSLSPPLNVSGLPYASWHGRRSTGKSDSERRYIRKQEEHVRSGVDSIMSTPCASCSFYRCLKWEPHSQAPCCARPGSKRAVICRPTLPTDGAGSASRAKSAPCISALPCSSRRRVHCHLTLNYYHWECQERACVSALPCSSRQRARW